MPLVAAGLGIAVGLVLGALGGGGSVLAVPALVYVLGQSPGDATTGSLVIVVVSSLVGVVAHGRAGTVKVRAGLVFGAAGLVTSVLAAQLAKGLSDTVVLTGFAVVMLLAAGVMWRSSRARPEGEGGPAVRASPLRSAVAGAGVGALIGVFGVGGGFLAVPALVAAAGFTMADAVGTSLLVIAVNAGAALTTRASGSTIDWSVVAPFAIAASIAAVGGQRVAARVSAPVLQRAFAVLLVVLAGWVLVDQLVLN